jgi:signal transduction histidine kinase/CHASE1-domain containing sensor protein
MNGETRYLPRSETMPARSPALAALRRHAAPLAVAATGLACAFAAWLYVRSVVRSHEEVRWAEIATGSASAVRDRMDHYTAALRAAGGFVEALGHDPTGREIHAYVDALALPLHFPGIQGLGWSRAIRAEDLLAHVRAERDAGRPEYRVWPEGLRPLYSSIIWLEPLDWRNQRAIGFDMFSEPIRRAAMERARDEAMVAASGRVELVQEVGVDRQWGFLMYLPVYARPPTSMEERTSLLRGWVYMPFRATDLLRGVLGVDRSDDVRLEVYDGAEARSDTLLYADPGDGRAAPAREAHLVVGGRPWTLRFVATGPFLSAVERSLSAAVLLVGLALTALLARITRAEVAGRLRAERSSRRTAFLAEAGKELAASLDYPATLARIARLASATIADACAILLLEPEGPRWAAGHPDRARAAELEAALRWAMAEPGAARAIASLLQRSAMILPGSDPARVPFLARSPALLAAIRESGLHEALLVPLHARGEALGAFVLLAGSRRRFRSDDLGLAEDLGRLAAAAIDTSRLFQRAKAAVDARDEFLSIASHELKTPLTSLALQADSLRTAARRADTEGITRKAEVVRRNVERLARLVASLLDLTKITAGRLELELESVDLAEVTREVATRFEEEAARARCPLTVDAPAPVPGRWDRLRVDQVVTNLLSNAVKYGPGRPIELRVRSEGDRGTLAVQDHGIGIPEADQPRIFGRFERAVSKRHYGGFGLGLWIVREIVDALGGEVRVESAPGLGSTFTVSLPREPALGAAEEDQPAAPGA